MTSLSYTWAEGSTTRAVLIDFDWEDADLLPSLLRQPGLSVRLVAGERNDDAGLRVAELCGLPRTVDLADLTREIFDLALVGERSARRTQVEGLLLALGTPCATPRAWLDGAASPEPEPPAIEAPLALHAAAFETTLGGASFGDIVEHQLPPDLGADAPTVPQPVRTAGLRGIGVASLADFPSAADRLALERVLVGLVADTGAAGAVLQAGRTDGLEVLARVGPDDPLLSGLVDLAVQLNQPQVVSRLTGPHEGKAWGAWPFRTTQRRGVLAAAAIDPAIGWLQWERMVEELRTTWDERDREKAAPAFPLVPEAREGWMAADEFRTRLDLAVERNSRDGLRFTVHRLLFAGAVGPVDALCRELPQHLRATDCICRPVPDQVLLLTAGDPAGFVHAQRRLMALWERVWHAAGLAAPATPVTDESVTLGTAEDAPAFLTHARRWLGDAADS